MRAFLQSRGVGVLLTTAIVVLALVAASVHLSLGSLLFLLNGLGYLGLAGLIVIGYLKPHPFVARFDWFPRLALMGYAATTIVGYLIIGPYSTLGWATKAVEAVMIGLLALDLVRVYGGVRGVWHAVVGSVLGRSVERQSEADRGSAVPGGVTSSEIR